MAPGLFALGVILLVLEHCSATTKVHGEWSSWSSSSSCDAECGGGKRNMTRLCDSPPPAAGGDKCVKADFSGRGLIDEKEEPCNTHSCQTEWGSWESWESCSRDCGVGSRTRRRQCLLQGKCVGKRYETEECKLRECRDSYRLTGEEVCESDPTMTEKDCLSSGCCHWNTWEFATPRCYSNIGNSICHAAEACNDCVAPAHCKITVNGPKCVCPEGRSGALCRDTPSMRPGAFTRLVESMLEEYDETVSQTDLWILLFLGVTFLVAFIAMIIAVMKRRSKAPSMAPMVESVVPTVSGKQNMIYQPLMNQTYQQPTYYLKQ